MAAQPNSDRDSHVVTRVTKYSGTQYWTITDFSSLPNPTGSCIRSNEFYTYCTGESAQSNDDARYNVAWRLELYPRGSNQECKDYVSMYFKPSTNRILLQGLDIAAQVTVGKHKNTKDLFSWKYDFIIVNNNMRSGWEKCFPRARDDKILDDFVITCTIRHSGSAITVDIPPGGSSNPTPVARADDTLHSLVMPIYHSGTLTDAHVKLRDGTIFKIHKLILAARSPVFMKMFTGDFKEARNCKVTIPDISSTTCRVMIDHIYGKELPGDINMHRIQQLLYVSDKYELDALKADCLHRLVSMISKDNVTELLLLGSIFHSAMLQEACRHYINANSKDSIDAIKLRYVQRVMPEVNCQLDIVNKLITSDVESDVNDNSDDSDGDDNDD